MQLNYITIKNLLTYGNAPVTYTFNKGKVSVITGANESGKSSIISALYFALTGKPYQDCNKGDLVNNVNKKDCLVELSFNINETQYLVKRGIKPNLFEIYKDNIKIDESSHTKDYQEVLEGITGLTPAIIKQILIISNRFYTPFLELTAADKREFIETILGITLLSEMADNLKKRLTTIKQEEAFAEKDMERINSNLILIKEFIEQQNADSETKKAEVMNEIEELVEQDQTYKKNIKELETQLEELREKKEPLKKYLDAKDRVASSLSVAEANKNTLLKQLKFYSSYNNCPTCKQEINKENLQSQIDESNETLGKLNEEIEVSEKRMDKIKKAEARNTEIQNLMFKAQADISKHDILIANNTKKIIDLKNSLNKVAESTVDNESKLISLKKEKNLKEESRIALTSEKKNVIMIQKMISDKGIKRYILNKYIPVLNTLVNNYLEILQAKYRIIFDEELNDKLLGKGYENLTYSSLSSGAKQRYDLGLMFSFIEIAKMKNNINCNVICFDETMGDIDDLTGVGKVFDVLKEKGYSINLITHDDRLKELGDINYKVTKPKFTKLEIV